MNTHRSNFFDNLNTTMSKSIINLDKDPYGSSQSQPYMKNQGKSQAEALFEKKKSVTFDQTFVNDEEDLPHESRKVFAMNKSGPNAKAVVPGQPEIMCTRSGRITSQVTIKPQAL